MGRPPLGWKWNFQKSWADHPPPEDGIEFFGKLLNSSPTTTHYLTGRDTESAADHL
jgi:hypothetical protein